MDRRRRQTVNFGVLAVVFAAASALADDGVPITITNDGTADIVVTVYDMNAAHHLAVVPGEQINGFSSVQVTVTPGRNGKGHGSWAATTVDTRAPLCGHADKPRLEADAAVHVHADASCSAP